MSESKRALTRNFLALALVALAAWAPAGHTASLDPVTLPGTGDSTDVLRALAQGYMERYPDRQVTVPNSIGSDGGVRVVGTGEFLIGRVARLPNADEVVRYGEFKYMEFARVPVAFVVTVQAGVRQLSQQQVCDIFSGRIDNWKAVGGGDLPIDVQWRPDGSNLQTIRKHIACFAKLEVTPKAHFNERNPDLVASLKTFGGAIGFMPLSEAVLHGYQTVSLEGVTPSMPQYPLGIGLGFVHKGTLSAGIQAFLDYLETEPAREIMRRTGHIPAGR
jgi:phosphate transport system substrate-binding protein